MANGAIVAAATRENVMTVTDQRFRYEGADGAGLAGFRWSGSAKPKAVIQLAHGAGEHAHALLRAR